MAAAAVPQQRAQGILMQSGRAVAWSQHSNRDGGGSAARGAGVVGHWSGPGSPQGDHGDYARISCQAQPPGASADFAVLLSAERRIVVRTVCAAGRCMCCTSNSWRGAMQEQVVDNVQLRPVGGSAAVGRRLRPRSGSQGSERRLLVSALIRWLKACS